MPADLVAEVLELTHKLEVKRKEAIGVLLAERRDLVKTIDANLEKLGYTPASGSTAMFTVPPSAHATQKQERKKRGPMSEEHKRKLVEARARARAARLAGENQVLTTEELERLATEARNKHARIAAGEPLDAEESTPENDAAPKPFLRKKGGRV